MGSSWNEHRVAKAQPDDGWGRVGTWLERALEMLTRPKSAAARSSNESITR